MPYFLSFFLLFFSAQLSANEALARQSLQEFLTHSLKESPHPVEIKMDKIDLSPFPPCAVYAAFSSPGAPLSGKTWVGLRCVSPQEWETRIPIYIALWGQYVVVNQNLRARHVLTLNDLSTQNGDLTKLPLGALTQPQEAEGLMLTQNVRAGQMLLESYLKKPFVIQKGQRVRLIYEGSHFTLQSEGFAENEASTGEIVKVKMPNGQKLSGTAREDGMVMVQKK